ncbi:MAG: hypothetical protein KAV41_03230, partial [Candidatus Pacebacteria bacterium]|nr:hypothetical protein [Candidatus Paceibacterota bacterium]
MKKILDKYFWSVFREIPKIIRLFSLTEKIIFLFFALVFIACSLVLLNKINQSFLVEIPARGGSLTEGVIGSPRFINPILAVSNADRDLCALIYSGLLKATPGGELIPDLAETYEISEDGFVYSFKLKDDIYFHDNRPVSTEDIEFTIKATQNDIIKSPKRANWDGVKIKRLNEKEIQFILTQPYAPFLENLTIGILPKHIWGDISPEQFAFSRFNIAPLGSGPYKIDKMKKNSAGILKSYQLKPFEKYILRKPYISKLVFKLYPDEKTLLAAYNKNKIESINSISPEKIEALKIGSKSNILSSPLPRIFGVFFNQDEAPLFMNKEVRVALELAVNRGQIIEDVLENYGVAIDSPVPYNSRYYFSVENNSEENKGLETAKKILEKNGWRLNEDNIREKTTRKKTTLLSFSLSTAATP